MLIRKNAGHGRTGKAVMTGLLAGAAAMAVCTVSAFGGEETPEALRGRSALITNHSLYDYDEETYKTYGTGNIQGVILGAKEAEQYPELAAALESCNASLNAELTEQFDEYCAWARDDAAQGGREYEIFVRNDIRVRRFDPEVFSFVQNYSSYSGGAHGYYSYTGHSFDTRTGEEISLSAVIADDSAFRETVLEKLKEAYPDSLEPNLDELLSRYAVSGGEYAYSWVLERDGILVMFNPYEIAAYASGAQHVHIGFEERPELFTDAYHAWKGACAWQVDPWLDDAIDVDGDGQREPFAIRWDYDDYESYGGSMETAGRVNVTVQCGQDSCTRGDLYYFGMNCLMLQKEDGRKYLYLDLSMENDYHSILAFDLSHASPVCAGPVDAGFSWEWDEERDQTSTVMPMDPEEFILDTRMQILSTYDAHKTYHVGEDGLAVTEDPFYVVNGKGRELTTVRELPVTLVEAAGPEDPGTETEEALVPAGEKLTIWRTDGTQLADMKREDGSIVRVHMDGTGWPRTIAGVNEADYFEMLYYAG